MSDLIRTNRAATVFPNGRWEYANASGLGGLFGLAEHVAKRLGGRLELSRPADYMTTCDTYRVSAPSEPYDYAANPAGLSADWLAEMALADWDAAVDRSLAAV